MKATTHFRLWGKKRGARSTGSRLAGRLGEALFFGTLFLLGTIILTVLITSQVLHPTPELYRPGFGFWLTVLVASSLTLLGGIGALYSVAQVGASAERRSALVRRAAEMDLIRNALPSAQDFPCVPRDTRLTDSPGVHLAYRLPTVRRTAWTLATFATLALLLSGFASVLAVLYLQTVLAGSPAWPALAFALPFLAAAAWAVHHFLRAILQHSRLGLTVVEISDLPLRPGGQYEIFLSQTGRFRMKSLTMVLLCEEEATYHQGTDIRTETKIAYKSQVFSRQAMELEASQPCEVYDVLMIPPHAMHSFQAAHNAVRWKLVVHGAPAHWQEFNRDFPILIYPNTDGSQTPAARTRDAIRVDHGTAD